MIKWLLAAALVATTGALAFAQGGEAWWLTQRVKPADTVVEGIPIASIDPNWVAASVLTPELLPPEGSADLKANEAQLSATIDLDRDGRSERVVVGVYRARNSKAGQFILVLEQSKDGAWKKRAVKALPGEARFSFLFVHKSRLHWADCMECDTGSTVELKGNKLTLK